MTRAHLKEHLTYSLIPNTKVPRIRWLSFADKHCSSNILRGKAMNLADLHLVTFLTKNVGDKR